MLHCFIFFTYTVSTFFHSFIFLNIFSIFHFSIFFIFRFFFFFFHFFIFHFSFFKCFVFFLLFSCFSFFICFRFPFFICSSPHGAPQRACGSQAGLHRKTSHALSLNSFLAANVPVNSCTVPDAMEGYPTNRRTSRTEGLAQTCSAVLHCRTGHRGLKSTTEELREFRALGVPHCSR